MKVKDKSISKAEIEILKKAISSCEDMETLKNLKVIVDNLNK